jgi:hypothetical protein
MNTQSMKIEDKKEKDQDGKKEAYFSAGAHFFSF